jgi:hypothetical protein
VSAEAAASRVVVELTVPRTPAEASRPEPVAVTTVVEAVAVVSANLKNATPLTKAAFVSDTEAAGVAVVPSSWFVTRPIRAVALFVVKSIVWFAASAAPVFNVTFIKRPVVADAPVTVAPVTVASVAVVTATPVVAVNEVFASPAV